MKLNLFQSALIGVSVGCMGLGTPLPIGANEVPTQPSPTPAQPVSPPSTTIAQPEQAPVERSLDPQDEDRVYIRDVYPEYCRSYFLRRDWVSLFEYREGMYRCLYGPDRWR